MKNILCASRRCLMTGYTPIKWFEVFFYFCNWNWYFLRGLPRCHRPLFNRSSKKRKKRKHFFSFGCIVRCFDKQKCVETPWEIYNKQSIHKTQTPSHCITSDFLDLTDASCARRGKFNVFLLYFFLWVSLCWCMANIQHWGCEREVRCMLAGWLVPLHIWGIGMVHLSTAPIFCCVNRKTTVWIAWVKGIPRNANCNARIYCGI